MSVFSSSSKTVTVSGGSRERDFRTLRWDKSSVVFQLLAVARKISQGVAHGVAAKFFQGAACQGQRYHGLGGNPGGWNDAHVGALVSGFTGCAGREVDRLQRPAQRGDRLQVAAHANFLTIGDAAFDASGIVVGAGEGGECRLVCSRSHRAPSIPAKPRRQCPLRFPPPSLLATT